MKHAPAKPMNCSPRWPVWRSWLILLLSGVPQAVTATWDSVVEVDAVIHFQWFKADGTITERSSREFFVKTDGQRWLIRPASRTQPLESGAMILGSDGRDVYNVVSFSEDAIRKAGTSHTNRHIGSARTGTFPWLGGPNETLLWLALCSASSLAEGTAIPSLRDPLKPDSGIEGPHTTHTLLQPGGLPLSLEQYASHLVVHQRGPVAIPLPDSFDGRYLEFEYQVGATTNLAGVILPLSFEARYYTISQIEGPSPSRYLITSRSGVVTALNAADSAVFPPEIPGPAYIYDYRFPNERGRPTAYTETSGGWLDRDDPELPATIASKTPLVPAPRSTPTHSTPRGALAVLLAALLLPAFVLCARFIRVYWRPRFFNHHKSKGRQ